MARFRIPGHRSGALHFWFAGCAIAGTLAGSVYAIEHHGASEAEQRREVECAPVVRTESADAEGWQMLLDQGYTGTATRLVPPGCESVNTDTERHHR